MPRTQTELDIAPEDLEAYDLFEGVLEDLPDLSAELRQVDPADEATNVFERPRRIARNLMIGALAFGVLTGTQANPTALLAAGTDPYFGLVAAAHANAAPLQFGDATELARAIEKELASLGIGSRVVVDGWDTGGASEISITTIVDGTALDAQVAAVSLVIGELVTLNDLSAPLATVAVERHEGRFGLQIDARAATDVYQGRVTMTEYLRAI